MTQETQSAIADLWAAVDDAVGLNVQRPAGSVTAAEYAEHAGIAQKTASDRLRKAVVEGRMTVVKVVLSGKPTGCYSPAVSHEKPMVGRRKR